VVPMEPSHIKIPLLTLKLKLSASYYLNNIFLQSELFPLTLSHYQLFTLPTFNTKECGIEILHIAEELSNKLQING
jgi:hypothetical protein